MRLWFQDEARFGRISDQRRCWAPLPTRPVVSQQVIREYIYALGAVDPLMGQLHSLIMPWVDSETMSIFLADLAAQQPGESGVMLLDGAGWHRANQLRVPPNIGLIFLPPYSPELNPMEHVWRYLRENEIGNRVFDTLDELEDFLCSALQNLMCQNQVVRSITCFEWINTLSMMSN